MRVQHYYENHSAVMIRRERYQVGKENESRVWRGVPYAITQVTTEKTYILYSTFLVAPNRHTHTHTHTLASAIVVPPAALAFRILKVLQFNNHGDK